MGDNMDKNVGGIERVARLGFGAVFILAAAAALAGAYQASGVISGIGLLLGAVLLITGSVQRCPINMIVGLNTYDGDGRDAG